MSEHETWYRAIFGDLIEPVVVTKVGDKSVWTLTGYFGNTYDKPTARRRNTSGETYHRTWREARDHLDAAARKELEVIHRHLDTARSKLATIQAMKEPDNDQP